MSGNVQALGPLARRSLAEQVADRLRDLILLEQLPPGAAINERDMSEDLGVSRTPLREALRVLASEGLVEMAPNRAPRVADPSLDDLLQLLQVQGALEALAGALACRFASDQTLSAIAALDRDMHETSDTAEPLDFFRRDMAFHAAIVAASGNAPLMETHQTYNARLWRARFISSRRRVNRPATLVQHRAIASALLARDEAAARHALHTHLDVGYQNICTARRETEGKTS